MKHALVVDDLEEGRYLLRAILQGNGYRVTMAGNGVAALEAARTRPARCDRVRRTDAANGRVCPVPGVDAG